MTYIFLHSFYIFSRFRLDSNHPAQPRQPRLTKLLWKLGQTLRAWCGLASVLILYTTTNFDSKEHKSYKATRALAKTLRTVIDPHRDQLLACMVTRTPPLC